MEGFIYLIAFACIGGWISRMCGGGRPRLPLGLEQWLYALPYGVVLFHTSGLVTFAGALLGKRMGHGQYIHLGDLRQPEEQDEKIDGLLRFFFGVDRGGAYWRCVAGLAVTGLAVTLPAGIMYAWLYSVPAGLFIACSGATKAPAYMLGRWLFRRRTFKSASDARRAMRYRIICGEFGTGLMGWGCIGIFL